MKKTIYITLSLILMIILSACTTNTQSGWQEQYDLGVRYLSDGNYEEAIIAFTAAIEIEPKRAEAYVGRGDAYIGLGETEENLVLAQTDYEQAIELDETIAEAYLGLADVYIRQGDYDKALEILQQGLEKTGNNEDIAAKIEELTTIEQWTADFSDNETAMLDNLLKAFSENDRDNAENIIKSDGFQQLMKRVGAKKETTNAIVYSIDYGDTVNGFGLYIHMPVFYSDGHIRYEGYCGNWQNGLADGSGIRFLIFFGDWEGGGYTTQWTTASCNWVEGFANGNCESLTTRNDVNNSYNKVTGNVVNGLWNGEVFDTGTFGEQNGNTHSRKSVFDNGKPIVLGQREYADGLRDCYGIDLESGELSWFGVANAVVQDSDYYRNKLWGVLIYDYVDNAQKTKVSSLSKLLSEEKND